MLHIKQRHGAGSGPAGQAHGMGIGIWQGIGPGIGVINIGYIELGSYFGPILYVCIVFSSLFVLVPARPHYLLGCSQVTFLD